MWTPDGNIRVLNLALDKKSKIFINFLKIRETKFSQKIPDISNLKFINLDEISTFKTAKRAEEHASGRYLLHEMLMKYYPHLECLDLEVCRDENRAPFLKYINEEIKRNSLPNFSISTSGNYVVVALSDSDISVGVDIERLNVKRSYSLFEFLSNGSELEKIKKLSEIKGSFEINRIWTAKESILKSLKLGFSISPTKLKVLDEDLEFKSAIQYGETKLYLENKILKLCDDYSFSLAFREMYS